MVPSWREKALVFILKPTNWWWSSQETHEPSTTAAMSKTSDMLLMSILLSNQPIWINHFNCCIQLISVSFIVKSCFYSVCCVKGHSTNFTHQDQFTCKDKHYLACEDSCVMSYVAQNNYRPNPDISNNPEDTIMLQELFWQFAFLISSFASPQQHGSVTLNCCRTLFKVQSLRFLWNHSATYG